MNVKFWAFCASTSEPLHSTDIHKDWQPAVFFTLEFTLQGSFQHLVVECCANINIDINKLLIFTSLFITVGINWNCLFIFVKRYSIVQVFVFSFNYNGRIMEMKCLRILAGCCLLLPWSSLVSQTSWWMYTDYHLSCIFLDVTQLYFMPAPIWPKHKLTVSLWPLAYRVTPSHGAFV